jgi:hypothetical protein
MALAPLGLDVREQNLRFAFLSARSNRSSNGLLALLGDNAQCFGLDKDKDK